MRLARTMRCAMALSLLRKARAISAVLRPPRLRRVSATRASIASAGWQQVKISRRRSSAISPSPSPGTASGSACSASSRSSAASLSRSTPSRRRRSIARLRATWVIQAPGLAGTPSRGQRSRATTKASWTASSATSKSPVTRISVATARPDSCRKVRLDDAVAGGGYERSAFSSSSLPSATIGRISTWPLFEWDFLRPGERPRRGSRPRSARSRRAAPWSRRRGRR